MITMCCFLGAQHTHWELNDDRREMRCHDISHCVSDTLTLIPSTTCVCACVCARALAHVYVKETEKDREI